MHVLRIIFKQFPSKEKLLRVSCRFVKIMFFLLYTVEKRFFHTYSDSATCSNSSIVDVCPTATLTHGRRSTSFTVTSA